MRIEIQSQAFVDLEEIYSYSFITFGEIKANDYAQNLNAKIESLIENPYVGYDYSFIAIGLQRLIVESHSVFYRVDTEVITIIRVLHQSRDVIKYL